MKDWQIITGDCAAVLPTLDEPPALIVSSPPYGNLRLFGGHEFDGERVIAAVAAAVPEGGIVVWNVRELVMPDGFLRCLDAEHAAMFKAHGLGLRERLIWHKPNMGFGRNLGRHGVCHELLLVFTRGKPAVRPTILRDIPTINKGATYVSRRRDAHGRVKEGKPAIVGDLSYRRSIWSVSNSSGRDKKAFPRTYEHPAIFPLQLIRDLIKTYSSPGDLVLDPMCGSGTTVKAAVLEGRRAVGIEIHAPYAELARDRMAAL